MTASLAQLVRTRSIGITVIALTVLLIRHLYPSRPILPDPIAPSPLAQTKLTIPPPDEVAEMTAEMKGSSHLLPNTGPFVVPRKFYRVVCDYFARNPRKDDYVDGKPVPQAYYNKMIQHVKRYNLGKIYFKMRGDRELHLAFYSLGKGAIGFLIGDDCYIADSEDDDGAVALLYTLDQAREAAGVRLPPLYPPPIESDDSIASLIVSTVRRGPDIPEITNFHIPVSQISTIMRRLRGRVQTVPQAWPEAQRLGRLNLTLRDGRSVMVNYYQAPPGDIRFSVGNTYYRSLSTDEGMSSDSLDDDIRFVISCENFKNQ